MAQQEDNILADSISGIPHLAAFDKVAFTRMNSIEIDSLLVYIIDTRAASVSYSPSTMHNFII